MINTIKQALTTREIRRKLELMRYLNHNIYDSRNRYYDVACAYP